MDLAGLGILGRQPIRKRLCFVHKDQLTYYGHPDQNESCDQYRRRYRFREQTSKELARQLDAEIAPKAETNNALSIKQRLHVALRFYATGTFQAEIGDGEGVSQSSMYRCIALVSDVLARHLDDLVCFQIDKQMLEQNAAKFYGFKGSEYYFIPINRM